MGEKGPARHAGVKRSGSDTVEGPTKLNEPQLVPVPAAPVQPAAAATTENAIPTHPGPEQPSESVPRRFRRLWMRDPALAERYAADQVYYNNANVPLLLGKAVVLREHYFIRRAKAKKAAAPAEAPQPPAASIGSAAPTNTSDEANPVIFYGSMAAARRVMIGQCYCGDQSCGADCKSLTALFGPSETDIKPIVDRILEATYGTADNSAIQAIRANLKKQKIL